MTPERLERPRRRTLVAAFYAPAGERAGGSRAGGAASRRRPAAGDAAAAPRAGFAGAAGRQRARRERPDGAVADAPRVAPRARGRCCARCRRSGGAPRWTPRCSTGWRRRRASRRTGGTSPAGTASPATTPSRALLAAMQLPADDRGRGARQPGRAGRGGSAAPLPPALVVRAGEAGRRCALGPALRRWRGAPGASSARTATQQRSTSPRTSGVVEPMAAPDGRLRAIAAHRAAAARRPGAIGLGVDGAPELACHLTVAPPRCHLPAALRAGGRRLGHRRAALFAAPRRRSGHRRLYHARRARRRGGRGRGRRRSGSTRCTRCSPQRPRAAPAPTTRPTGASSTRSTST